MLSTIQLARASRLALIFVCVLTCLGCNQTTPITAPDTRIIEIDWQRLRAGDLRQNVAIRDGDVIRVSEAPLYESHELSPLRESDYRASLWVLRPGGIIHITIFELVTPNVDNVQTVRINDRGIIRPYRVGPIQAAGLTRYELEDQIRNKLNVDGTLRDATVSVLPLRVGQFTAPDLPTHGSGSMPPGTFSIDPHHTRLLQVIRQIRGLSKSTTHIYIIRPLPEPAFKPVPGALSGHVVGE